MADDLHLPVDLDAVGKIDPASRRALEALSPTQIQKLARCVRDLRVDGFLSGPAAWAWAYVARGLTTYRLEKVPPLMPLGVLLNDLRPKVHDLLDGLASAASSGEGYYPPRVDECADAVLAVVREYYGDPFDTRRALDLIEVRKLQEQLAQHAEDLVEAGPRGDWRGGNKEDALDYLRSKLTGPAEPYREAGVTLLTNVLPNRGVLHKKPLSAPGLDDAAWLPCCGVVIAPGDRYAVAQDDKAATCFGAPGGSRRWAPIPIAGDDIAALRVEPGPIVPAEQDQLGLLVAYGDALALIVDRGCAMYPEHGVGGCLAKGRSPRAVNPTEQCCAARTAFDALSGGPRPIPEDRLIRVAMDTLLTLRALLARVKVGGDSPLSNRFSRELDLLFTALANARDQHAARST